MPCGTPLACLAGTWGRTGEGLLQACCLSAPPPCTAFCPHRSNCSITGSLPGGWALPTSLEHLNLALNRLTGRYCEHMYWSVVCLVQF